MSNESRPILVTEQKIEFEYTSPFTGKYYHAELTIAAPTIQSLAEVEAEKAIITKGAQISPNIETLLHTTIFLEKHIKSVFYLANKTTGQPSSPILPLRDSIDIPMINELASQMFNMDIFLPFRKLVDFGETGNNRDSRESSTISTSGVVEGKV